MCIDEFNGDNFDHGPAGFRRRRVFGQVRTNGRPIESMPVRPARRPGARMEKGGARQLSQHVSAAARHASFYAYRDDYLDLDPTYKDRFGRPLLRMTFDLHDNELKMSAFLTDRYAEISTNGRQAGGKAAAQRPL